MNPKQTRAANSPKSKLAPNRRSAASIDLSELDKFIGFRLHGAQLHVSHRFRAKFSDILLTPAQYSLLTAVRMNPGAKQGEIGSALMIKRANMTKMIRELTSRRLIARHVAATDKRSVEFTITKAGERLLDDIRDDVLQHEKDSMCALDINEQQILMGLLGKLLASYRG